jgi:hypothetical protein
MNERGEVARMAVGEQDALAAGRVRAETGPV